MIEGHALAAHMHLCLSIPPKFSVANTVGCLKGKSAIRIHREYLGREERNFTGFHVWARGSALVCHEDVLAPNGDRGKARPD